MRVLVLLLLAACGSRQPPPSPSQRDATPDAAPPAPRDTSGDAARVKAFVDARGGAVPFTTQLVTAELGALWPAWTFWSVYYDRWPVATAPAKGLQYANVLVVDDGGEVHIMHELGHLDAVFAARFNGERIDSSVAERAARAYLWLVTALFADGFYAFEIVEAAGTPEQGTARALATAGGNGELSVTLRFPGSFKAELVKKLVMGPRPRCHATKLLDPDPIVRQIVRDDLHTMGCAARRYLETQRDLAAPPLRREIESLLSEVCGR
jgi:hypothetical protein